LKKYLIKGLDFIFGLILSNVVPAPIQTSFRTEINSILVIRPGGIGDAVLLLPMLHELALLQPDAKIDVLAESRNSEVFSWSPHVSATWRYDYPLNLLKLFRRHYDLIIDTEQYYRLSAVVARLMNAPRSIGFATNTRSRLFTDSRPYHQERFEAEMFLELLEPLRTGAFESTGPQNEVLVLPQAEFEFRTPYVVLFPGASVSTKQWPIERYAEVARYCEESGFEVVVVGGKADIQMGEIISHALKRCRNLVGKTNLSESASIVAGAALMISGDSGLLHVAQLLNIPTVALFGPSNPNKWSKTGAKHIVVSAKTDCAPCSQFGTTPPCPFHVRCMREITPVEVFDAAMQLLSATNPCRQKT